MPVKSELVNQLAKEYSGFLKRDLRRVVECTLKEMEDALVRQERVELRDIFTMETRVQKTRISRNPKNLERVEVPEKLSINFKISRKWFNKLNNE